MSEDKQQSLIATEDGESIEVKKQPEAIEEIKKPDFLTVVDQAKSVTLASDWQLWGNYYRLDSKGAKKIAAITQMSMKILNEWREEIKDESGRLLSYSWYSLVEVTEPTFDRTWQGVGECSTTHQFHSRAGKLPVDKIREHNIRSHARTLAMRQAIVDLWGIGEIYVDDFLSRMKNWKYDPKKIKIVSGKKSD